MKTVSSCHVVSVGLPFRNNATTLRAAINSVRLQSKVNWELILVDDGSSDGSLEIAQAVDDSRVRVLSDGKHLGLAARLNQVSALASGSLIARMDADDLMHPERLSTMSAIFERDPKAELAGSSAIVIDERNRILGKRGADRISTDVMRVLRSGLFLHPTVVGRTEWFRSHPYNEKLKRSQDRELWIRTAAFTEVRHTPQSLMFYRESQDNAVEKLLASEWTNRRTYMVHAPAIVGWGRTTQLILRSLSKDMIYRLADYTGRTEVLLERRNRPLSVEERAEAERVLWWITDSPFLKTTSSDPEN